MEQKLNDRSWRMRSSACLLLSLIPFFGFWGFLFMGKKSKQKRYTRTGMVYGLIFMAAFAVSALGEVFSPLYGALFVGFLLWPACAIHTLTSRRQYLHYLAWEQEKPDLRSALVHDRKWRRKNSWWRVWACLPFLGGLSTYFMGRRLKDRRLKLFAVLSLALCLCLPIIGGFPQGTPNIFLNRLISALQSIAGWGSYVFHIMLCALYFEDYLDAAAKLWEGDARRFPHLVDAAWRRSNSTWQIFTFFPLAGNAGLLIAGVQAKSKKVIWTAILLEALELTCLFAPLFLTGTGVPALEYLSETVQGFWNLVYVLIFYYGTLIRGEILRAKAERLIGYRTQFERDYAVSQIAGRTAAPVRETPAVQQAAAPVPPAAAPRVRTDLNKCDIPELTALPGVSVADARKAMEYRREKGGFRSVDEFVDLLEIKPHFAVQIFRMAEVSPANAAQDSAGAPAASSGGRVFDL